MALVLEKQIGNTHTIIMDDFCRDVPAVAVEEILRRIAQRALAEFSAGSAVFPAAIAETP